MAFRPTAPDLLRYYDFTIAVRSLAEGILGARVIQSPAGESGEFTFQLPVAPPEVEDALASVMYSAGNYLKRSSYSATYDPIIAIGEKLYQALIRNSVMGRLLQQSQDLVNRRADGLRLRVVGDDPAVLAVPWEFLFDSQQTNFLALSLRTPITRQVSSTLFPSPPPVTAPLDVLVAVAEVVPVGAADELKILEEIASNGLLNLRVIEQASVATLRSALEETAWHVLHFIGTGAYATGPGRWAKVQPTDGSRPQQGVLLLGRGRSKEPLENAEFLPAATLAALLADAPALQLVVLNACKTELVAATLAQRVPAVVGVRSDITDLACGALTRGLYEALSAGQPLEAAVTLGRQSIDRRQPGTREWGLPTFYLGTPDGALFAPTARAEESISTTLGLTEKNLPPPSAANAREARRLQSESELEQRNLDGLLAQKNTLGEYTPDFILRQIEEVSAKLERLKRDLTALMS
jgi:hypothetical protein